MLHALFPFLMQEKMHCYSHWDSVVSVAAHCGMGGLGFEPHWGGGQNVLYPSSSIIHMYNWHGFSTVSTMCAGPGGRAV